MSEQVNFIWLPSELLSDDSLTYTKNISFKKPRRYELSQQVIVQTFKKEQVFAVAKLLNTADVQHRHLRAPHASKPVPFDACGAFRRQCYTSAVLSSLATVTSRTSRLY